MASAAHQTILFCAVMTHSLLISCLQTCSTWEQDNVRPFTMLIWYNTHMPLSLFWTLNGNGPSSVGTPTCL
jgi:hypothetical protein